MNKIPLIIIAFLINGFQLFAQDKKEKKDEKVPVYNYSTDDPMDAFNRLNVSNATYIYVPEFCSLLPPKIMDTTYKYECYDSRDSIIWLTQIHDITEVRFISLFKSYPDSAHMYTDVYGVRQPLPVSSIIRRYDRVGDDKWMSIDYKTNKYTTLKESRTYIVRTDTVLITDPMTNKELPLIYCYYKVETINKN